jgi:hypothetical protein
VAPILLSAILAKLGFPHRLTCSPVKSKDGKSFEIFYFSYVHHHHEVWYLQLHLHVRIQVTLLVVVLDLAFLLVMADRLSKLMLAVVLASQITNADLIPTAPGPGQTFTAGSNCTIIWDVDQSGLWKNVTIGDQSSAGSPFVSFLILCYQDLMSGSNTNMSLVTNVISGLDGTNTSSTPYNWTCPEVDPYSAIYFYQVRDRFLATRHALMNENIKVHKQRTNRRCEVDDSIHGQ